MHRRSESVRDSYQRRSFMVVNETNYLDAI
jgi:hypothetical protein